MRDFGDVPDRIEGESFATFLRRRRQPGKGRLAVFAAAILVLAVAGGTWFWLRSRTALQPTVATPEIGDTSRSTTATEPPLDLPALDASDAFVRQLAASLSAHPQWAKWLVTDDLVQRFVAAVVSVSSGASPAATIEFLDPGGEFRVRQSGGRTLIDAAGYRRYDLVAQSFASLDTEGTARLYRQLHPLFEEAYREQGFRQGGFDDAFALAVQTILAVNVPSAAVEVVPTGAVYEFRDASLAALSSAEKHLLRMGPDNARRVQAKLRELASVLGIDAGRPAG